MDKQAIQKILDAFDQRVEEDDAFRALAESGKMDEALKALGVEDTAGFMAEADQYAEEAKREMKDGALEDVHGGYSHWARGGRREYNRRYYEYIRGIGGSGYRGPA